MAKDKYMKHVVEQQLQLQEDVKKEDSDSDDDGGALNVTSDEVKAEVKSKCCLICTMQVERKEYYATSFSLEHFGNKYYLSF